MIGIAVLVGIVSAFAEGQGGVSPRGPYSAVAKAVVSESLSPEDVTIFDPAIHIDAADVRLNLANFVGRERSTESQGLRVQAACWNCGNGAATEIGLMGEASFFREATDAQFAPMPHIVGRSLATVFNDGERLDDAARNGRREIAAVSDANMISEDVGSQLSFGRPSTDLDLDEPEPKQAKREQRDGVASEPEYPSPSPKASAWLPGSLAFVSVTLIAIGLRADEWKPRLSVCVIAAGAVLLGLAVFGLSDALCGGGAWR